MSRLKGHCQLLRSIDPTSTAKPCTETARASRYAAPRSRTTGHLGASGELVAGKPALRAGALPHVCPENQRIQKYAIRARSPVTFPESRGVAVPGNQ